MSVGGPQDSLSSWSDRLTYVYVAGICIFDSFGT